MAATNSRVLALNDEERTTVEHWLVEFEQTWDEGRLAARAPELPPGPLRLAALIEMVKIDLERNWQQGRRLGIEAYLSRFPELGTVRDTPADLLQAEVEVRRLHDAQATLPEWAVRWPQRAAEVLRLFDPQPDANAPLSTANIAQTSSVANEPRPRLHARELPERFGRYHIRKKLGQGGMGAVYLAHDDALDRLVALKVPTFSTEEDPDILERFHREARAAATLRHPNICPIYDVGQIDGITYLTMAYIEGQSLSALLKAGLLPLRRAAELVRQLAQTLAAAHEAGIIHRDLKPGNVLLTTQGEPMITDFGLARRLNRADERLTVSGALLGTPAYMAPEQIDGHAAGPGCDIYSLGVVLYQLLTGQMPFQGSLTEVIWQIAFREPPAPSALRPDLDAQLERIVMKAMAKKAEQRFDSMTAFAAALDDYLQTEATPALPRNRVAAVLAATPLPAASPAPPRRRPRRRLLLAAALLGALVLLAAGLIIRIRNKDGKEEVIKVDPGSVVQVENDKGKQIAKLEVPVPKPDKPSPEEEIVTVELKDIPTLRTIKGHTNTVNAVAISPDSKLLASGSADKTIRIWEVATGDRTQRISHSSPFHCLAFAPDGKTLAAGDENSSLTFWDVATGDKKKEFRYGKDKDRPIGLLTWAPDGKTLATLRNRASDPVLWDVTTGKERVNLEHSKRVLAIAFSPDSATVATASTDSTIRLWDAQNGKEKDSLRAHDGKITTLTFLDDKRLASGGADRTVIVWDVTKGHVLRPVLEMPDTKDGEVEHLFVTPSQRLISVTSRSGYYAWRPGKNKPLCQKPGSPPSGGPYYVEVGGWYSYPANYRVMSPDGKVVAKAYKDDVNLLDVSTLSGEGK